MHRDVGERFSRGGVGYHRERAVFHAARDELCLRHGEGVVRVVSEDARKFLDGIGYRGEGGLRGGIGEGVVVYLHRPAAYAHARPREPEIAGEGEGEVAHPLGGYRRHGEAVPDRTRERLPRTGDGEVRGRGQGDIEGGYLAVKRITEGGVSVRAPAPVLAHAQHGIKPREVDRSALHSHPAAAAGKGEGADELDVRALAGVERDGESEQLPVFGNDGIDGFSVDFGG